MPINSDTLCLFIADASLRVQHSTIRNYLSAIRGYHLDNGFGDPTNNHRLKLVSKGIRRVQAQSGMVPLRSLPGTSKLVRGMVALLDHNQDNHRLLAAMLAFGTHALLRVDEFTSEDPSRLLRHRHLDDHLLRQHLPHAPQAADRTG